MLNEVFIRRREPRWYAARQCLRTTVSPHLWDWLLDPGSLTQRLQLLCGAEFRVQVMQQGWGAPLLSERRGLGMLHGERAIIREVRLLCGNTPWVFARTVIPVRALRGRERRLVRVGSKSLGAALFADPHLSRGEMEITRLTQGDFLFDHAAAAGAVDEVWGRRSCFSLRGKNLLVSEFFLPALLQRQEAG